MSDFFRAHKAVRTATPTYFIESTAPDNVDDVAPEPPIKSAELEPIDSDLAVRQIAAALVDGDRPNLVVMVHGFNNPQADVFRMYTAAAEAIAADSAISGRQGLVCVGYRWPSEKMGEPIHGTWDALPTLPTWILYLGAGLVILPLVLFLFASGYWRTDVSVRFYHVVTIVGLILAGLVLTAALLRTIVYFRDNYRATNYGVPDLVQIIRAIDGEIVNLRGTHRPNNSVQLSFIGHSMGGFVVTNTIRVLSDVFSRNVQSLNSYGAGSPDFPSSNIGKAFNLRRFVLVSPDIPAETLLSNRGNFLASTLSKFHEAYLFSNEGDEVLRQISTLANYFVFPTKKRKHGFRLGNVEILSSQYGLLKVPEADFLRTLRIGNLTLQELYDSLERARVKRHAGAGPLPTQTSLPKVFTYFDCTDYVEPAKDDGKPVGLLTFAKCLKRNDPTAKMRWYSHLHLLLAYVFCHQKPNVHGGYFEGARCQQLIYRLACLGYDGTEAAYGGEPSLAKACAEKQIRVLISPMLAAQRAAAAVAQATLPLVPQATAPAADIGAWETGSAP
jgi:pimeloyl-ACP methyl ester carboxylesterase